MVLHEYNKYLEMDICDKEKKEMMIDYNKFIYICKTLITDKKTYRYHRHRYAMLIPD